MRARLLLLVLSLLAAQLVAALWLGGAYLTVAGPVPTALLQPGVIALLLLLGLSVGAALWVTRGIVEAMQSLERDTEALRQAQVECGRLLDAAVARAHLAEQRGLHGQRVEALGRLTSGVAHDFNNALGVISNSAHLIERLAAGRPELQAPVAATLRAVAAGSQLIRHLVRVAGRESAPGQGFEPARHLLDVQELLQTVLGKRAQISVVVAQATHTVAADPGELELALINLVLNARDAMPGGGQVWLKARNADAEDAQGLPPGAYVLITITDDGSGIDEGVAARAFEPFFTTKPLGKGTGMGLSQVHRFCAQAGGAARIASTPGLGTTVSLLLPAGPSADGPVAPVQAGTPSAGPGQDR